MPGRVASAEPGGAMPGRYASAEQGGWLASALVTLGVVVLTTGPLYRIRTWWDYEDPLADDAVVIVVQALVSIAAIAVLATGGRWRLIDPLTGGLALALAGWLLLSTAWSLDRSTTVREVLQIGSTLAAGAAAATLLPARRLLWCTWVGVHAGLAWSAIAIALERPGTQDRNGDWAGVFFNRNSLALWAALGLVLSILLLLRSGGPSHRSRGPRTAASGDELLVLAMAGVADVVLLAATDALTPLVAVAAALGALAAARAGRGLVRRGVPPQRLAAIAGAVAVVLGSVLWALRDQIVSLTGRDADLTGRSDLWSVALDWAWRRPVSGYGYLGAWHDAEFLVDVREQRGRILSSAHNSFVDVLLGGGVLALVLLVALVAVLYLRAASDALTSTGTNQLWPLALLVFVVVENLTETLLVGNHLTVAVFGALAVSRVAIAPGRSARPGSSHALADRAAAADPSGRR